MLTRKACKHCGKHFEARSGQTVCSRLCSNQHRVRGEVECVVCGSPCQSHRGPSAAPYCEEHTTSTPAARRVRDDLAAIEREVERLNAGGRPDLQHVLARDVLAGAADLVAERVFVGHLARWHGLDVDAVKRVLKAADVPLDPTGRSLTVRQEVALEVVARLGAEAVDSRPIRITERLVLDATSHGAERILAGDDGNRSADLMPTLRRWKGADHARARELGARWLCPTCGPVNEQPLHGDDERLHCLECDAVVDAVLPEDDGPAYGRSYPTSRTPTERVCGHCQVEPVGARRRLCLDCKRRLGAAKKTNAKKKPKEKPVPNYKPKACPECGEAFDPRSPRQRYCSKKCRHTVADDRRRERERDKVEASGLLTSKQLRQALSVAKGAVTNWKAQGLEPDGMIPNPGPGRREVEGWNLGRVKAWRDGEDSAASPSTWRPEQRDTKPQEAPATTIPCAECQEAMVFDGVVTLNGSTQMICGPCGVARRGAEPERRTTPAEWAALYEEALGCDAVEKTSTPDPSEGGINQRRWIEAEALSRDPREEARRALTHARRAVGLGLRALAQRLERAAERAGA